MKKALVVGGTSGLGLGVVITLLRNKYDIVYVVGRRYPQIKDIPEELYNVFDDRVVFIESNLIYKDFGWLDTISNIDSLYLCAGIGKCDFFENNSNFDLLSQIDVNITSFIIVLRAFYNRIISNSDFYCGVISSISGHLVSPLMSVYAGTKSFVSRTVESLNIEIEKKGSKNRICEFAPGYVPGTRFYGGVNDFSLYEKFAIEFVDATLNRKRICIPEYDNIYKSVLDKYKKDSYNFGLDSYDYKLLSGRVMNKKNTKIGYMSGTFDLFHIGHLNILKKAKEQCDYLIVGVHKSGAWKGKETFIPFDERVKIVGACRYVDKVIESYAEDCDAWNEYHYDLLFVGSDYQGSERFKRYELYFKDKNVKIVYFKYTDSTSSTKIREAINKKLL